MRHTPRQGRPPVVDLRAQLLSHVDDLTFTPLHESRSTRDLEAQD